MAKSSQCDRCRFFSDSPYVVCSIHPEGPESDKCLHFAIKPYTPAKTDSNPLGWYSDDWPTGSYLGKPITQPTHGLTPADQVALLDWHPIFTNRCPECEMPIIQTEPPRIHWDCEHCGWKDDSL